MHRMIKHIFLNLNLKELKNYFFEENICYLVQSSIFGWYFCFCTFIQLVASILLHYIRFIKRDVYERFSCSFCSMTHFIYQSLTEQNTKYLMLIGLLHLTLYIPEKKRQKREESVDSFISYFYRFIVLLFCINFIQPDVNINLQK